MSDATMCESDSFYFLSKYEEAFPDCIKYSSKDTDVNTDVSIATLFSTFHGRVKISQTSTDSIASIIPIDVFRYKMLEDQSYYSVKTVPSQYKPGYIVEGAYWSNGMYYLVREEKPNSFIEINLYIDLYTKGIYNYP
jgi:hypothetical protein